MAEFNADAGPSPNCCAVLVQMEHCACNKGKVNITRKTINAERHIFIANNFSAAKIKDGKIIAII